MTTRCQILIVTYRSEGSIRTLLPSLREVLSSTGGDRFTAVFVDCGDTALVTERVVQGGLGNVPGWRFETAQRNLGFATAVNFASRIAINAFGSRDFVMLLNPDVEMDSRALRRWVREAEAMGSGISGPALRDGAGGSDRGAARRRWNHRRLWLECAGVPSLAPMLLTKPRTVALGDKSVCVDMVSGAAMLVQSSIFGSGLDTRLPMYLEDQEICLRARRLGYNCVVFPGLGGVHRGAESRSAADASSLRTLRVMELAQAPSIALVDWGDGTLKSARGAVLLGAVTRVICAVTGTLCAPRRCSRSWLKGQVRLASWLFAWAARGEFPPKNSDLDTILSQ